MMRQGKNKNQVKYTVLAVAAAAMLAACGGQQAQASMTQPIASEALTEAAAQQNGAPEQSGSSAAGMGVSPAQNSSAAVPAAVSEAGAAVSTAAAANGTTAASLEVTGDLSTDLANYAKLKAEEEAVGVEIGKLEAAFRVGSIAENEFRAQKQDLVAQENDLERQADILENAVDLAYYQAGQSLPEGDVKSLLSQKQELEGRQHETELVQDKLENAYWNGDITREEFISQMAEQIQNEEEQDRQEEALEDALERLGWDD